jgi:hypothetical protein
MEELIQAAEATHVANLAIADVEAAFLEGESSATAAVKARHDQPILPHVRQQNRIVGTHSVDGHPLISAIVTPPSHPPFPAKTFPARICNFKFKSSNTAGTADQDVASYLSSLQSEAEDLLLDGKGAAAEAAAAAVAAAAAEMEEAGDVPEAPVVAELGRKPLNYGPKDVLESMSNDEAIAARR